MPPGFAWAFPPPPVLPESDGASRPALPQDQGALPPPACSNGALSPVLAFLWLGNGASRAPRGGQGCPRSSREGTIPEDCPGAATFLPDDHFKRPLSASKSVSDKSCLAPNLRPPPLPPPFLKHSAATRNARGGGLKEDLGSYRPGQGGPRLSVRSGSLLSACRKFSQDSDAESSCLTRFAAPL